MMITFIRKVLQTYLNEGEPTAQKASDSQETDRDRRAAFRFRLGGFDVDVRGCNTVAGMQLKDLSCTGGAGITGVAVPVGGTIFLYLPCGETRAAEVRWTRNTSMGFRFIRPLELETVLMLYRERWNWIPKVVKNEIESAPPPLAANAA